MNLESFFDPKSIALIGASADPHSISARPLRMLLQHGYPAARLFPVNPKYQELQGLRVFPSVGAIPEAADLALIAIPAPLVPGVLHECVSAGVQHAIVLSSGFAESNAEGARLQEAIADVARSSTMRINGPNAEGFYAAGSRVCATFSPAVDPEQGCPVDAPAGGIAVISQSGGLGFAILNQGRDHGLDFHTVISTGNEVDLSWIDFASHLVEQPQVGVIVGFIEGLRQAERLPALAERAAELRKPLIVVKIGRSEAGRRAAVSHTASDTGSDAEFDALFERLGILRADDVDDMLDLAAYFSTTQHLPRGRRVGVLTTSGGAGAWLADACSTYGFELPLAEPDLQGTVRSFIPPYGSTVNPIDITAQAVFGGGFERALHLMSRSPSFDVVVGVGSMVREERFLSSVHDLQGAIEGANVPIVFYAYTRPSQKVLVALRGLGIPCYSTPGRAARVMAAAYRYRQFLSVRAHEGVRV